MVSDEIWIKYSCINTDVCAVIPVELSWKLQFGGKKLNEEGQEAGCISLHTMKEKNFNFLIYRNDSSSSWTWFPEDFQVCQDVFFVFQQF